MRHIHKHLLIFVLLIIGVNAQDFSAEKLNELLDRLETNLSAITSIDATFKQHKHISLFDEVIEADGRLLFQQPKSIRFEITQPFRSVLIVADKKVAKYEMNDKAWRKIRLQNSDALALVMNQIADWMKGDFRSQSRVFALSAREDKGTFLVLTPKPAGFAKVIKCIEIRLAENLTDFKSITIREPDGDHTVLEFVADKKGGELPTGAFDTARDVPVEIPSVSQSK